MKTSISTKMTFLLGFIGLILGMAIKEESLIIICAFSLLLLSAEIRILEAIHESKESSK